MPTDGFRMANQWASLSPCPQGALRWRQSCWCGIGVGNGAALQLGNWGSWEEP